MMSSKLAIIIGPSGVGKTTLAKGIEEKCKNWKCLDLDDLAVASQEEHAKASALFSKIGADKFLKICFKELKKTIKGNPGDYIAVVGAGCLESSCAICELNKYKKNIVLITACEKEAYDRILKRTGETRSIGQYRASEFSDKRKKIYALAGGNVVDTTGIKKNESIEKLQEILKKL